MPYREQRWVQRKIDNLKVDMSKEFLTVKSFFIWLEEKKKRRRDKTRVTAPTQRRLNTKRSLEWHKMLVHCNFDESDYLLHLTFDDKHMPKTKDEIDKEFTNYIKRINRKRKKLGLENTKYVGVIEGLDGESRVHFHLIMDGELSRETLEELWHNRGIVNVNKLQIKEEGVTGLIKYMFKMKKDLTDEEFEKDKHKRGWRSSKGNLRKPVLHVNDNKFTKRKMKELLTNTPSREEIEKMYPGYTLTSFDIKPIDEYGHIYMTIEMRRYVKNEKIKNSNLYKPIRERRKQNG